VIAKAILFSIGLTSPAACLAGPGASRGPTDPALIGRTDRGSRARVVLQPPKSGMKRRRNSLAPARSFRPHSALTEAVPQRGTFAGAV
jgi:hypothetical protein